MCCRIVFTHAMIDYQKDQISFHNSYLTICWVNLEVFPTLGTRYGLISGTKAVFPIRKLGNRLSWPTRSIQIQVELSEWPTGYFMHWWWYSYCETPCHTHTLWDSKLACNYILKHIPVFPLTHNRCEVVISWWSPLLPKISIYATKCESILEKSGIFIHLQSKYCINLSCKRI